MPRLLDTVARSAPTVAVILAASWGVGAVAVVRLDPTLLVTSYAGESSGLLVLAAASGLGLITAGALGTLAAPRGSLGALTLLAGAAWIAPGWVGWEHAPTALRGAGLLLAPSLVPLLVHITTLDSDGRTRAAWDRQLVVASYLATGAVVVSRILTYDPMRDRDCWLVCRRHGNPFLVWSHPELARALGTVLLIVTVLLAGVAVTRAAARLHGHGGAFAFAATLPAGLALLGELAYAVVLFTGQPDHFEGSAGIATYVARAAALLLLAAGVGWATAWRLHVARRRVGVLATGLGGGSAPGELESRLAHSLRDDSLDIIYRIPGSTELVDAAGQPARLSTQDQRAAVSVTRAGEPVATVLHDPRRVSGESIEVGLGALARLVIDNERLRASISARLAELRESRARVVATGDELRRAIEHDLHDGAQQRLLAAAFELRLTRADCAGADRGALEELDRAVDAATIALEELREFAHGVFPAVLDEARLEDALFSLTDGTEVPVDLTPIGLDEGIPASAARAAYMVVRSVVESAPAGAVVGVRVERKEHVLVVEIHGGGSVDHVRLEDRVGAVGGDLLVTPESVRAVIPCES